ncbi:pregnancy zone protein-like [Diadema antillarum]|uniref:pregnancy zone protein-like n=1 Tax=Diadema antillarum TaxID=105358 RepID=UPI003A8B056C
MQQWRNQEGSDGLIDLELPMTPDPVLGTWTINAVHKGRKSSKTFEVDEYVLPKFEIIITPPPFIMINATNITVKVCGRYTYGQPVRGFFNARVTVKSEGWNSRERRTINRRIEDTGPSGCSEFPVDVWRFELNSTDFSLWNARLSVDVEYTEASTGVMLTATSESSKITRDALKLQFDAPNIFKPGVPYYGKILVTYPDGSPAGDRLISLSCNSDQGKIFERNFTSPDTGAIEFVVTDINITATSLNLYAFAPGFTPPPVSFGRNRAYTLHDPATSHYARPQYSPTGSFLQLAPIRGMAAVGSEQTLRIDYTANDPEENFRFRFVVMSRGNIIPTRFYRPNKRPRREAEGLPEGSPSDEPSAPDMESVDGVPSVDGMPSFAEEGPSAGAASDLPSMLPSGIGEDGSLQFVSIPLSLVLGGSSFSSDFSFVPPTDPPVVIVEPGDLYSRELKFRVSSDMVPETRILAYYITLDGEIVADSIAFRVQKKFENEVDISFSDEERMPGAETEITIRASPGSLCAVGVVDRSVHILGGDNQLKGDKIFSSLDRYQLSSTGGYLEPSTRCEPEEDEYPQFFPLGRKKRGIFLPGYGARYQDSSRAFKDMGLIYITNMDVETSPCVGMASMTQGGDMAEETAEDPIAVPLLQRNKVDVDLDDAQEQVEIPSNALETAPRIRSYFPETWLWDLRRTDSVTGETSISMEVPDTVTEWIGSGFCTSPEYGVGVSPPTKLRAFQPFFLSYTLPYSVVRGEVVPVRVTVFNYLTESLVVEVTLERTNDFRMARRSRSRQKVCVGGSQSQSVEFRIIPRTLGNIALEALGLSVTDGDALCGNELVSGIIGARDVIYKELLVEAEGAEVAVTQNCYFCPEEEGGNLKMFNITLPANRVEGSARGKISMTGDMMGPSLSNLDHLIQLPTGCGEQNMLGFVPNIVALSYLITTNQLTPSIENKASFNMKRGYQRELNYRHRDGSYSAFGENDEEGSTWLTAFVVRSFAQAAEYIFIDEDDLDVSISWLKRLQDQETGCFQSRGRVIHKGMKGGVDSEQTLTTYILLTMLESGLTRSDPMIQDAVRCVTREIEALEDTYALAQLAYALTLAESVHKDTVLEKLESQAISEDGLKYWQSNRRQVATSSDQYSHQAASMDIEITAYILLAHITGAKNVSHAMKLGNPMARWIVLQRNSDGGFSSTQDTVVALQALAEFAKISYSDAINIKATVTAVSPERAGNVETHAFTINALNSLVLQEHPLQILPALVTLQATGTGCALFQVATVHNEIPETPEDAGFELDVTILEAYRPSKKDKCLNYFIKICSRYTGSDNESNMVIIAVKMVSGYYPDKESLRLLQKQHKSLQRYEVDGKNIFFYFNELTSEDTCLVFSVTKEMTVKDAKPGIVEVYDYYDKAINVKKQYNIDCERSPPSWNPSVLFTVPGEPGEEDESSKDGMRPLPFILAALRSVDGLVIFQPPETPEEGPDVVDIEDSEGTDGGNVNGNEKNPELNPISPARNLGPSDGELHSF